MLICIEIGSFVFEVLRLQIGNRRTDGQTDKRFFRYARLNDGEMADNLGFSNPLQFASRTEMYRHAKFDANRYRCRRDISNGTHTYTCRWIELH